MQFPLTKLILPFIALTLIIYFGYHLIHGDHGWLAWKQLETKLDESKSKLEQLDKEQKVWENRVQLMRPETLDPDMLDERVRHVLGNIKEDEVLVIDEEGAE
jgi:cell division protein FtsB